MSADRSYLLAVRHQFGAFRDERWYGYSAQPASWPGTPTRPVLVVLRRDTRGSTAWHELTIPRGTRIEDICAEGSTFRIRVNDTCVMATGDEAFRVIADCSFGPPGFSEVEIAGGFDKLAGRAPLEVVGPAEPDALLGHALALVIDDPTLGWFWFRPQRPARYTQTIEDGPSYELFADLSGRFDTALERAERLPPASRRRLPRAHGSFRRSDPTSARAKRRACSGHRLAMTEASASRSMAALTAPCRPISNSEAMENWP